MKMSIRALFVIIFAVAVMASGCGRPESYGDKLSGKVITPVRDILLDPEQYSGKSVIIKGKIVNECPSGCWFDVNDSGAVLYVDIEPAGLAIPQKVGGEVTVEGSVLVENNKPTLLGKGVELK